jgi:hypothetical protein
MTIGQPTPAAQESARRGKPAILTLGVLLSIVVVVTLFNHASPAGSGKMGASVHICSAAHHAESDLSCTQDDSTITDLGTAYLSGTPGSGTFPYDSIILTIAQQDQNGVDTALGSYTDTGNLGRGTFSWHIADFMLAARVHPEAGTTYRITMSSPTQSQGSTTFTYQPSSSS